MEVAVEGARVGGQKNIHLYVILLIYVYVYVYVRTYARALAYVHLQIDQGSPMRCHKMEAVGGNCCRGRDQLHRGVIPAACA